MDARQLMTPALSALRQSDTVVTAARRMRALGVSVIPVADDDNGFVGMLRERDIVENCVAAALDPRELSVGSILSNLQSSIGAGQVADSQLLGLLLRQPCGMLPVFEHGMLIGVITVSAIAGHLLDEEDDTGNRLWWPDERG